MQPASARVGATKPSRTWRTRDSWPGFARTCAINVRVSSMSVSLGVNILALNQLENVAVHYKGEDAQQEDQAHLDETFFYRDAQIATQRSLDEQHKDVATVEDRNWQEIQQAEFQADHGGQND